MGQKITLQNTGTSIGYINYQNLSNLELVAQAPVNPGQTLTIWCVTNSLNIFRLPNSNIVTVNTEVFPIDNPIPANPERKTEMVIGTIDSSPNWQSYVFNYDTGSFSSPVDTGVNYTNYGFNCCPSIAGLSKSGYMVLFSGLGNVYVRFYDYLGSEIESYSNESNDYNYYFINNKFLIFIDYDNGQLLYSDGVTVNTIEWNTNYDFGIDTDYDDSILNKFLIYSGNGNYSTYQLIGMDGVTPLMNYDNRFYEVSMPQYDVSNFIPAFIYNNQSTYSFFNIYDSNGKILQEVDLTNLGNDYNNYDLNYFGDNKMNVIFYNGVDNSVPYQIYVYDGNTNTMVQTTHEKGLNFEYWDTYYDSAYCGINFQDSQDFHIVFYDYDYGNDGDFITVDYCDVLSYFDSNSGFTNYVFASAAGYNYKIDINDTSINKSFQTLVDVTGGWLRLLTISSSGVSTNNICQLTSLNGYDFNNITYNSDTYIIVVQVLGGFIAYAYDTEGNQLDARPLVGSYNSNTYLNTIYVYDSVDGWYFNNKTNNFVPIGIYIDSYQSYFDTDTSIDSKNGYPILLKDGLDVRVIYNDSISSVFTLPDDNNTDWNINMSNNSFMYTYVNSSNNIVCEVYDLLFNIITSQTTSETSWNDNQLFGDRALLVTNTPNGDKVYGLSTNGNGSISILNNGYGYAPNDIVWWCGY